MCVCVNGRVVEAIWPKIAFSWIRERVFFSRDSDNKNELLILFYCSALIC